MPNDDLSLAGLLKSPLFGLTDDDLIALAPQRSGALIDALGASGETRHKEAHAIVSRWAARAEDTTPFAFYIELLGRDGGRRLMEARLGPEAHDAIDEFLRLALAHEQQGAPSLGAFLADVEALVSSIKRDMEGASDAVRVMTVHAAKGLEAKIVFLPDTCGVPSQRFDPTIFDLDKESGLPPLLVWSPRKADDPPVVARARDAERLATMREYRRLLYVALTRAEERLYIAGFYNTKAPPPDCWSGMIEHAFPDAEEIPAFWDSDTILRRIVTQGTADDARLPYQAAPQGMLAFRPEWLSRPAPATETPNRLRPSLPHPPLRSEAQRGRGTMRSMGEGAAAGRSSTGSGIKLEAEAPAAPSTAFGGPPPPRVAQGRIGAERRDAMAYGTMLHLLLQHLPACVPAERKAAARAYLAARHGVIDPSQHEALIAEALAVIAMAALAPLFTPEARAEVAVMGRAADGSLVDGKIDRLVVLPDHVVVADFKTGPPLKDVPVAYARQMALYAEVLAPLWPDRPIRTLLVWTAEPLIVSLGAGAAP